MRRRILAGVAGYLAIATAAGVDPMTGAQVGAGLWIAVVGWLIIRDIPSRPSARTARRLEEIRDSDAGIQPPDPGLSECGPYTSLERDALRSAGVEPADANFPDDFIRAGLLHGYTCGIDGCQWGRLIGRTHQEWLAHVAAAHAGETAR